MQALSVRVDFSAKALYINSCLKVVLISFSALIKKFFLINYNIAYFFIFIKTKYIVS